MNRDSQVTGNATFFFAWPKQCTAAAKARKNIGMVHRHFKRLDDNDCLLIHKFYIRPHLEYCIEAWSLHLLKDIEVLEQVQKSAVNLLYGLNKFSYVGKL